MTQYALYDSTTEQRVLTGDARSVRVAAARMPGPFRVYRVNPDGTLHIEVTACVHDQFAWAALRWLIRTGRD